MAPLRTLLCSAEGCCYQTPPGATDFKTQMDQLTTHIQAAHPENHVTAAEEERPEAFEGMKEQDWREYLRRWTVYKQQLSGKKLIEILFQTMSKGLAWKMNEHLGYFPKKEGEFLAEMKKLAVKKNPRCNSLDHMSSSSPAHVLKTLRGEVEGTSLFSAATKNELLEEVIFCFMFWLYFTPKMKELIDLDAIQTADDVLSFLQTDYRKGVETPRNQNKNKSQSSERSRSRSPFENKSESKERGRKRKSEEKGESKRVTRSKSRTVRWRNAEFEGGPNRDEEPAPDITRERETPLFVVSEPRSAKKRTWNCSFCGK